MNNIYKYTSQMKSPIHALRYKRGHLAPGVGEEAKYIPIQFKNYIKYARMWDTASVVQWSEFLATEPEVPGSIPGASRFSEK
jgi:hypothetical protein